MIDEHFPQGINKFDQTALCLDPAREAERIVAMLREVVSRRFHRNNVVVGISGGVDSAVVLALCVRAFGSEHVTGAFLPERDSSPESAVLAQMLARQQRVQTHTEDLTPALEAVGCYRRRDEAIQSVIPQYQPGWPVRVVLPGDLLEQGTLEIFSLVVTTPTGEELRKRLAPEPFAQIIAASNMKQRLRMTMLYYLAEQRKGCVIGTENKNEHELGFFVKHGDAGVDVSPISHLYKTQVYQMAQYLDIPDAIRQRIPTTDTYPGGGSQQEFFFRIPYALLDIIWYGTEHGISKQAIAAALNLTDEQVQRVVDYIWRKKRTAALLRTPPVRGADFGWD